MPQYIQLPDGGYFPLKAGEKPEDAWAAAFAKYPKAFGLSPVESLAPKLPEVAPKTGIGSALIGGAQRYGSQFRTGLGGGSEAAEAGVARMEEIEKARPSQVSLEKVKQAYQKDGVLSAAGEALGQVPYAIAEQVPQLASMGAGARLGSRVGSFFGPVGTAAGTGLGALTGQFLSSYVPTAGANLEAQARAQIAEGKPVDVNPLAAYGTAVPIAALDVFTDRLLLGKGLVGRLMGFTDEQVAKKSAQELEKLASEKLLPKLSRGEVSAGTLLKGTAKGTVEIPIEIAQQMLERAQAGLPLTNDEALADYGNAAYQAGLLSPLGGVGRISERGGARSEIAQRKKQAADAAFAAQEAAATQPANLLKLFDDYTAAKEEASRLSAAIPAAPSKKKKPQDYAKWEEDTAGAREAASDHMENILRPLRDAYRQREDLIKPLVAQRQATQAAAQPAAAPAAPPAAPPAPPTVTDLMDQYDALYQQRDQLGAQIQAAAGSGDSTAIIPLHDQWQALTKQVGELGKAIEGAGGTIETADALDKKLAATQKEMAKAAEVGDFDTVRKQAEKLAKLQQMRALVEGRPSRTPVAEQPEVAAPVTEMPAAEELAPKEEAPPPSITPYDFPTPYEMFGARSVADLNAPFDLPTPMEMFGDVDLDRATKFVRDTGKANITHLEQGLNVKRQVAAQLLMDLEKAGIVTPLKGNKREVIKETPTTPTAEAPAAEAPAAEAPKVETKPTETPPAGPVQHAIEDVPPVWLPVNELKLSKDVPQFKEGADQEGVVKPLKGEFAKYAVAPIQVWRRLDGSLEIISGRHRWDLAKRSGRQTIAAQIFDESAGFDKKQAATMDAEINIRDDQGTVSDYVNYFQGAQLSKEEANARGLTRGKGEEAIEIATNGSPELIAAHRAKQVSDSLAASIATEAPKDSRIQAVAIKAAQNKSAAEALNLMRAVQVIAPKPAEGGMADMFGFDESAMLEAQEMAKIATQKQREVGQRLSAITGASKNPKLAAAEGIDIKDPEAVKRRIADLRQLKSSWDNWTTNSDLVGEIRAAMKPAEAVEQPQVNMEVTPARLGVDAEDLENAIKQIEALQAETIVGEDNTPKVQALIKELEAAKIINEARADEEISLIGTEEAPLTILKDRLVRLVDLLKAAAARERSAKRNKNKNAPPAEGTLAQDAQEESDDQGAMFSLGTTDKQKNDAKLVADTFTGAVVWQEGDLSLVRAYHKSTGQPVYIPAKKNRYVNRDVNNDYVQFRSTFTTQEIDRLRQIKNDLETADAKKHAKNPFIKHNANGLAFSKNVPAEIRSVVEGWKKILGLDTRIYVTTVAEARANSDKFTGPHRAVGSAGLRQGERGSARYMTDDDSYYITYTPSTSKTAELELIAHELGHVHEKDVFKKAPAETQAAIKADFDKWLASTKGKTAREHINSMRAKTLAKGTKIPQGLMSEQIADSYWRSFGEWYADQVSRWSTTTDKPLTVVEKFFAKLGAAMRRFYTNAMQQKYLPAQSMQKFLDGIAKTAKNNGAIAPNAVDAAMDSGLKKQSPEKTFTGQGSLFRSKGEEPAVGMPTAEIEDLIKPFRQLPVAPKITVVQSVSELPEKIQAQMERDGTQSAPGMYHPPTETIYLVGDNLIDGADVGKTISHEMVGHFGLRGVLGNSYPAVMRSIYQNSKQIKAEANARMQDNPDMSLEVATEESIAERAEKDVSLNWMNRLVNLIRTKLRQWGIWKNAPIGDSEIIRLIRDSHKYVSGVTTKPSETVKALAQVAPTEADIKGHNRVEALYSGRGQKNFKEPVKTIKAYKLFRVKKNEPGKIYPLFIGKNEATAIGEWVPAEHLPTKGFAERPGWHAGILPMAPHLRTKENQMADDRVWAEVEIPADVNWQDVADTQKTRDIRDRVPVGGHYRFKTSKMQGGAWIIGGALKVKRVLSNEEVADILNKAGEKDAATREQMRNPALAEAFASTGKPAAPAGLLTKLRAITETPAFKRWFGDSKVVDASGKPMPLYHSTFSDFVSPKVNYGEDEYRRWGFHVGTKEAANNRVDLKDAEDTRNRERSGNAAPNVMPLFVRATNPLRLDENRSGRWGVDDIMSAVMDKADKKGIEGLSQEDIDSFFDDNFDLDEWLNMAEAPTEPRFWQDHAEWAPGERSDALKQFLKRLGYDSIVYKNDFEGGGDSYIIFDPTQIKSVFNKGEFNPEKADVLYRSRKPTKSVVAQRTSTADDLMALYTGLTGASSRDATLAGIKDKTNTRALKLRQRIFDQYAPLVAAVMKGVDAKVIDAFRAQNLMYFLRFGQQRSDIVGQTVTSGPPRVRSEKTSAGTEYFYENDAGGPTLVGMAQALEKAKGYKEEDRENAFTVYLAGKRAEQVGWNKLRFDNPVEAENEYKEVLAHLKQNPADKAAFEAAEKIYQNYNAGLLDFLVQTGAMSKQKAAELKSITYVPFYRVDKEGNIRMETGDERRSIRIGNIKSEPRLKELLGDSEQILPVFTSAVQNTSMLINMAMRNQTVKDTAFVLKDLGIASRIVASKGPYTDNVVHFRVNGVEHHAIIDTDMYGIPAQMIVEGLEGIKVAMPTIVRMLGVPGDIFRKFTVRNPLYIFRQLVRDPVSAWVQTGTSTVPILDSFSTLAKMATGKDTTAQRLQRAGATSSNVLVGDARDMTKFLEDLTAGKWSLQRAFSKLDTVAQQSDAATRQVIYEDSIKKGMSHQQALMRTLESMNFSRRGTSPSMYLLASLTPFMHSQVQGLDVLYRSMRGQLPGADKLEVAQRFAARATMLAVSSLAYAAVMQDDEDYKRAKPEERYGYWWVPTLGLTKENWLKIPIPYEIGFLFKALPEAMVNTAFGDEKAKPALSALWKALGQSVPLDIPQALKPALEVRLGSSLFSGDIESSREKEILPQYRYRTNSTEIAKMLGGVAGLSPIQIDYLIRGYTGGVGMAIAQMANVFLRAPEAANVQQPTMKLSEVPLIGSLFQTTEGRGALDATYNLIEEIQQYKGAYNKLIQDGKPEEAARFANENASVLAASSMAGYMKKTLGEMAKQARIIKSSPQMTTEQKDAALENLYISQLALSRNFLKNAERTTLR